MSLFSECSVNNGCAAKRGGKNSTGGTGATALLEALTQWMVYRGQDAVKFLASKETDMVAGPETENGNCEKRKDLSGSSLRLASLALGNPDPPVSPPKECQEPEAPRTPWLGSRSAQDLELRDKARAR